VQVTANISTPPWNWNTAVCIVDLNLTTDGQRQTDRQTESRTDRHVAPKTVPARRL